MVKLQAIVDKVVVQLMKREKSKGGLIIPDSVQEPQSYGVVVSIGEKVVAPLEVGDVLVFHPNAGMAMLIEGKIMKTIMENELYAIVRDKEILDSLSLCEVSQKDLDTVDKELKKKLNGVANGGGSRIIKV